MIKGDKMLTHNFKIINDPSQWDEDMKNFFNSLAEYWLSIHPKPILLKYLQDGRFISATTALNAAGNWKGI